MKRVGGPQCYALGKLRYPIPLQAGGFFSPASVNRRYSTSRQEGARVESGGIFGFQPSALGQCSRHSPSAVAGGNGRIFGNFRVTPADGTRRVPATICGLTIIGPAICAAR
jgi:hypothetical protein